MRSIVIFLWCLFSMGTTGAQEFDRLYDKSIQPVLSQPLQWVAAPSDAAPSLPQAFAVNPGTWAFALYTASTVLPTSAGRDAWVRFTLAATPQPQSWVIRVQRVSVQKVSLYALDAAGFRLEQSAGSLVTRAAWSRNTRTPSFEVMTGGIEKTYFLRIEHNTPITERPELMSHSDFADGASRVSTLIGLMFGMFGILMLICVAANALAHNTVFLSLAAFTGALLLQYLVLIGYGGWRVWPNSLHLNQAMPWASPFLSMAVGCWFFAQASYAKDSNRTIYHLLCAVAMGSFGLALYMLMSIDRLERNLLNGWAAFVLVTVVISLLWLSLRALRWTLWLVAGLLPIAGAGFARLAYNYGWLTHIELAQTASVFLTQFGLTWIFLALAWRNRDVLMSKAASDALKSNDPATGLVQTEVAKARLNQTLTRAARLKLGCGVIMVRWVNYPATLGTKNPAQRAVLIKQLAQVLGRVVRDIDTAAVLGGGYFMLLIEGPVNRASLASLATQVLASGIREAEKLDMPNAFDLHIAIWTADLVPATSKDVLEALHTRLNQMSQGTKRTVQFVDAAVSQPNAEQQRAPAQHRDELMAKIDAIEASPSVRAVLMPEKPRK